MVNIVSAARHIFSDLLLRLLLSGQDIPLHIIDTPPVIGAIGRFLLVPSVGLTSLGSFYFINSKPMCQGEPERRWVNPQTIAHLAKLQRMRSLCERFKDKSVDPLQLQLILDGQRLRMTKHARLCSSYKFGTVRGNTSQGKITPRWKHGSSVRIASKPCSGWSGKTAQGLLPEVTM